MFERLTRPDPQRSSWRAPACLASLALLALSGCGDSNLSEMNAWLAETRKATSAAKVAVPPPKDPEPVHYAALNTPDPFDSKRLESLLTQTASTSDSKLKPDLKRVREPLEAFPLESIRLVGYVGAKRGESALVRVNGQVYPVKTGSYLGQNFGVVTKMTENEIQLRERVQDGTGDWVEREAKLALHPDSQQESK